MLKIYLVRYYNQWGEEIIEGYYTTEEEANKCANAINKYADTAEDIEVIEINVQEKFNLKQFIIQI